VGTKVKPQDTLSTNEARVSVRVDRGLLQRFYVAAAAAGVNKRTAFARALRDYVEANQDLVRTVQKG